MPKLTREELRRLREDAKRSLSLREGKFRGKIIVHMGTCGIAAGARDVVTSLTEALRSGGVTDISLTTSGCGGLCSMEPMMTVEIAGAAPVRYGKLNAKKARTIFHRHVLRGDIVAEYALGVGCERVG